MGERADFPFPRTDLSYGLSDGYARGGVTVEHRDPGLELSDLSVEVSGHVLRDIRSVMVAANLSDVEKVTATQTLLDQGKTDDFDRLKDDLAATASEASWHDILEVRSVKLQNRLSPLLRALTFAPSKRAVALLEAIDHFRNDGDLSANSAPMGSLIWKPIRQLKRRATHA